MDALNPKEVYTYEALKKLTKEYGLSVKKVMDDSGHGKILEINEQHEYNLRPETCRSFQEEFLIGDRRSDI
jgi:hypothetical protein